jgi:hypothetical protein
MIDFNKLLYLPLDIKNPPLSAIEKFNLADKSNFFDDTYRNCKHLQIFRVNRETKTYYYTDLAKQIPELIEWLETEIFSWADRGNVVIITTQPGELNPSHIDCSPKKFVTTNQHKLRYVFQGRIDTLHFEHSKGVVTPAHVNSPFIMSGKWPHHMLNTNTIKYTLAFGSPWEPSLDDPKYLDLLTRSYEKYKDYYQSYENLKLNHNWVNLFEKVHDYEEEIKQYIVPKQEEKQVDSIY